MQSSSSSSQPQSSSPASSSHSLFETPPPPRYYSFGAGASFFSPTSPHILVNNIKTDGSVSVSNDQDDGSGGGGGDDEAREAASYRGRVEERGRRARGGVEKMKKKKSVLSIDQISNEDEDSSSSSSSSSSNSNSSSNDGSGGDSDSDRDDIDVTSPLVSFALPRRDWQRLEKTVRELRAKGRTKDRNGEIENSGHERTSVLSTLDNDTLPRSSFSFDAFANQPSSSSRSTNIYENVASTTSVQSHESDSGHQSVSVARQLSTSDSAQWFTRAAQLAQQQQPHPPTVSVFSKLYMDTASCDALVRTRDGVVLPVHRNILASGSRKLRDIVLNRSDTLSHVLPQSAVVYNFKNVDSIAMQILLKHLYTVDLRLGDFDYHELIDIHDVLARYQADSLLHQIRHEITHRIDPPTLYRIWYWAHTSCREHDDHQVLQSCVNFFFENHSNELSNIMVNDQRYQNLWTMEFILEILAEASKRGERDCMQTLAAMLCQWGLVNLVQQDVDKAPEKRNFILRVLEEPHIANTHFSKFSVFKSFVKEEGLFSDAAVDRLLSQMM